MSGAPGGDDATGPVVVRRAATVGDAAAVAAALAEEGLVPARWANGPGDCYGRHDHPYTKVLVCVTGGIVFHIAEGDVELGPGDRLELAAGVAHAATVSALGVECVEAPRS